ncbi:MAG: hypothetical protein K9H26_18165 [Prolixibacteraceae bacterium]|nr:hypothetical protein [Prolixibacteraceae bacterium]
MVRKSKISTIEQTASNLIGKGEYGKALNYLQKKLEENSEEIEIERLISHLKKILEYLHRDIFASTNLDMDPWFE